MYIYVLLIFQTSFQSMTIMANTEVLLYPILREISSFSWCAVKRGRSIIPLYSNILLIFQTSFQSMMLSENTEVLLYPILREIPSFSWCVKKVPENTEVLELFVVPCFPGVAKYGNNSGKSIICYYIKVLLTLLKLDEVFWRAHFHENQ